MEKVEQAKGENAPSTSEPTIQPVVNTENTTPVVNTSDASNEEINKMLENSPESTPGKSKKPDHSDREKNKLREFLTPKPEKKGPPDWKEYKPVERWGHPIRRYGKGYSDIEISRLQSYTKKHDEMVWADAKTTLRKAQDSWRGTTLDVKMPPTPEPELEPEPDTTREPVIRVNAGSIRPDNDTRQTKTEHDAMVHTLSAINSSSRTNQPKDRLMSELLNDHSKGLTTPKILAGTNGMRMIARQKESELEAANAKRRASYQTPTNERYQISGKAPSISYGKSAGGSKQRKSEFESEADDESDAQRERCHRKSKKDPEYPGWGDPEDPEETGWGGNEDPRDPYYPGRPGGSGGPRCRRRPRDDDDSDGWDRNVKMKHPTPYNGKTDIQTFDYWMASITNYAKTMKIRE